MWVPFVIGAVYSFITSKGSKFGNRCMDALAGGVMGIVIAGLIIGVLSIFSGGGGDESFEPPHYRLQ